jgi:activator of 2-hydroxyglutaryl-CoA dehydratase
MISMSSTYVGVDVGASRTKVAILDRNRNLLGYAVKKSGVDFSATAAECLRQSLDMASRREADIAYAVSTGYGRSNVAYAMETKTEIGCHARGCYLYFPKAITIIDIGGQDNKIIKLDAQGRRAGFKMNRKCAAGTGAFLEETSLSGTPTQSQQWLLRPSFFRGVDNALLEKQEAARAVPSPRRRRMDFTSNWARKASFQPSRFLH